MQKSELAAQAKGIKMFAKRIRFTALLLCMFIISGCASQPSNSGSSQGGAVPFQVDENTLVFSNLKAFLDLMGKTAEELAWEENGDVIERPAFLWSRSAEAEIIMKSPKEGEKPAVSELHLSFSDWTIHEAFTKAADFCSGPIQHGYQPEGSPMTGAWYLFDAGEYLIRIEETAEPHGILLTASSNPSPGFQGNLILKKEKEESSSEYPILTLPSMVDIIIRDYSRGILTVSLNNRSQKEMEYTQNLQVYRVEGDELVLLEPVISELKGSENQKVKPMEDVVMTLDLRIFGKVLPGKYMAELDGMKAFFTLIEEVGADTP